MTPSDIIRAWKDPRYRAGLPATQLAQLPAHPAGAIELPEPTLHAALAPPGLPRQVRPPRGRTDSELHTGRTRCGSAYGANLWQDALPLPVSGVSRRKEEPP